MSDTVQLTPGSGARTRPRPVFCVNEHAYRRRDVAEEACAGRFSHCGLTLELGTEPDWLGAAFPDDEEWRIDWIKFYYGRDLASAFRTTGEPRFLRAWEQLVASWIRQVPTGSDSSDETARRIQNWVYAWGLFAESPAFRGLREGLADELVDSIAEQAAYVRSELTADRNHRTLELYALFTVALALPEISLDGELLAFTVAELHRNLLADTHPDGVHVEQSTHYHHVVLRSFLGLRENARRARLQLPEGFDDRLGRMCEFALHAHRPDGQIPAVGDADAGCYLDLLELAARLLDRPDLLYAATAGAAGRPPASRNASFPHGGYLIQRSGWGEGTTAFADERFAIFDCGPLGNGGHGHYDALSFEAAAGGRPLVVDPGRYTYAEHEADPTGVARNLRHWFKGTAGHNTVRVDGLDQTPYHAGKPRDGTASSRLLDRCSAPGLDVVRGEVRSPCYEAVHRRRVVFVADELWLIEDELLADGPHRYELRFHLGPEAHGHASITPAHAGHVVRAPGLALVLDGRLEPALEQGWFSRLYGVREPAPVVLGTLRAASVSLVTLLAPLGSDRPAPAVAVRRQGDATTVVLSGAGAAEGVRDAVAWAPARRELDLGAVRCRARAAWLRTSPDGAPLTFGACDAQTATWAATGEPVNRRAMDGTMAWNREKPR